MQTVYTLGEVYTASRLQIDSGSVALHPRTTRTHIVGVSRTHRQYTEIITVNIGLLQAIYNQGSEQ